MGKCYQRFLKSIISVLNRVSENKKKENSLLSGPTLMPKLNEEITTKDKILNLSPEHKCSASK
jgi:hypothetical protein